MHERILAGILERTNTLRYTPSILAHKDTGIIVLDAHLYLDSVVVVNILSGKGIPEVLTCFQRPYAAGWLTFHIPLHVEDLEAVIDALAALTGLSVKGGAQSSKLI